MTLLFQVTWTLLIILTSASFCLANLDVTYEWKYIDYVWETDEQKAAAVGTGTYDYTKIITNDIQPLSDGRILVTTPKYHNNPASLSTISDQSGEGGPLLSPYPNWSWHKSKNCLGITSVNRLFLDDRNRLWLVDSGKIGNEQVCPAKILAFNTTTDELLKQVEIPNELSHNADDKTKGRLEISAVEISQESEGAFWVYISDLEGYGLIIWDGSDIWRLNADIFYPDPDYTTFDINGENVTLSVGPSSVLLTPEGYLEKPGMMFKAMSSVTAYSINLEDFHNSKNPGSNITINRLNFTTPNQELARAFSKDGGILITGFTMGAIACWNLQYTLVPDKIGYLDTNVTNLQFVSGVKITQDSETGAETVWGTSNRLQSFVLGTMDFTETNFRILKGDVTTLVSGTVCEVLDEWEVVTSMQDKFFLEYETLPDALYKSFPLSYE